MTQKARSEIARDSGVISVTPISGLATFRDPWTFFAGDLAHLHWKNDAELIFDSTMGINKQESLPEPRHPTQQIHEEFGNMIERSKIDIPYAFSQAAPRNIYRFQNTQYKMHEWWDIYDWLLLPSLFLLGFPLNVLNVIDSFVCGCRLAWQHQITEEQRLKIREYFANFVTGWEKVFVQGDRSRLVRIPMCIHHLLHVADWILWWGPGILYS
ncbi:hypothetical protein BT69DRAFT_1330315 [Atractiella rhizophila]|nr:hypothetical protein BT69DRAFT_1330315 [Atractiella rhizophila]